MTGKARQQSQKELQDDLTVIQIKSSINSSSRNDKTIIIKPQQSGMDLSNDDSISSDITCFDLKRPELKGFGFDLADSDKTQISPFEHKKKSAEPVVIKVGSIIQNRFVVEELLGIGGMGKVYKAIDLRKQEAQDKSPYIAIKVLNDEFRDHPEALIALQREARKSQQLSHPNIVNVHDFDRDGAIVYMTMELLQGKSLDRVIADDYPNGMPIDQAVPIINSVANAVAYAHQHGIVHSDLKPSNVFISSNTNVAKIFDFGIARACNARTSIPDSNLDDAQDVNTEVDKTIFDPTQFGALTPTYASVEMLKGYSPEQNDDLYSIACVFYELLTGKHPYKRLPADEVQKQNLRPLRIPLLNKFQLGALLKSLEIEGKNRFTSVDLFIQAFNQKKQHRLAITMGIILLLILSVTGIFSKQLKEYYNNYQQDAFIISVNQSDFQTQPNVIDTIPIHINQLDEQSKRYVLKNIKDKWLFIVQHEVNKLVNVENDHYYIDKALKLLLISQQYYPDSAQVAQLFEFIEEKKYLQLNQLNDRFNELIEVAQLSQFTDKNEQQQIVEIINTVKRIEPTHPLVKDQRLLYIYKESIEQLLTVHQTDKAQELLRSAQGIFADNPDLQNLKDKLKAVKSENNYQNDTVLLDSVLIDTVQINDTTNVDISNLKEMLSQLIEQAAFDDEWDSRVTLIYSQLFQELGKKSLWLSDKAQTLAALYLQQSVVMRDKQRLIEARRFLDKAKQYNEGIFGLNDEETILSSLENIVRVKHKAKQQLFEIEALKTTLQTRLRAQKMNSALRIYKELKRIIGPRDPYMLSEARPAIAQAFYKQARQLYREKMYDKALMVTYSGRKFDRRHYGLRTLQKKIRKQQKLIVQSQLLAEKAERAERAKRAERAWKAKRAAKKALEAEKKRKDDNKGFNLMDTNYE